MKILSVIPARGGSKGIPMKNIVKINGKSLLHYSINSSLNSKYITKTIVTTDNQKIANEAKRLNADVVIRPKKLSTDKSQIEPAIEHVLKTLKKKNFVPDIIILLQNTSPLRNNKHVDEAIEIFLKKKYDSIISVYPAHEFLWRVKNDRIVPISYDPKKRPNRQQIKKEFLENGSIYITKFSAFIKSKCRVSGKIGIYEMTKEDSLQIDSKEDLKIISSILKKYKNTNKR